MLGIPAGRCVSSFLQHHGRLEAKGGPVTLDINPYTMYGFPYENNAYHK
jgi:hypothetical protein